jgi:integrase
MTDAPSDRPAYLPILALPYWGIIGAFVEAAVHDSAIACGRDDRDLFAAATPMVLWAWRARGVPLERHRVFQQSMVEQFIHLGMPGAARGSQATLRSTLWRMTEVLNPAGAPRPHRPIPRSEPTTPYTDAGIAELYSWANTQGTPQRSRDALVLLALGLGTGLPTRELLDVRTGDISIDTTPDGTATASVVVWRTSPRVVPVLPDWVRTLQSVHTSLGDDSWLFCPGRTGATAGQVSNFLTRTRTALDVRPARMRATWLVRHLADGTPAAELLRISGLQHYAALDRFLRFLPNAKDF